MKIRELATALSELDEALGYYGNVSPFFAQALMDEILIVAYAHFKHRPGYWRNRLFELT